MAITDIERGLVNRLVAAAAPKPPAKVAGTVNSPIPEGIGFIGDYEDWSGTWQKAANKVLEPEFKGGSASANIQRFKGKVQDLIAKSATLGSNSDKASPIGYARDWYKRVRTEFGKLGGDQLKGVQLHHEIEELAQNPLGALDAENLIFARGQAASEDTLHWILHEMTRLRQQGVANPGREAMSAAAKRGLIPKSLLSPTVDTPSTRVKSAVTAAESEVAPPSGRAMDENQQLIPMSVETSTEGANTLRGAFEQKKKAFINLGDDGVSPAPPRSKTTPPAMSPRGLGNDGTGYSDELRSGNSRSKKDPPKTKEEAERRAFREYLKHKSEDYGQ
jgi:hypothetical protein